MRHRKPFHANPSVLTVPGEETIISLSSRANGVSSTTVVLTDFNPSQISGAVAIWDALTFTPASWPDSSGNSKTASQSTVLLQGSLVSNALNGQPGALFSTGQQMSHALSYGAPGTILAVVKTTGSAAYRGTVDTNGFYLMAQNPDGKWGMYMDALVEAGNELSSFTAVSVRVTAPNNIAFRTGGTTVTETTGTAYYLSGNQSIGGASGGQDMIGTICYLGIWDRVLTGPEIAEWETYANLRWGIS